MTRSIEVSDESQRTVPAITTMAPPAQTAGPAVTCVVAAGRNIRKFVRTPQMMVVGTIQGAMFMFIFRYVLGGSIESGLIGVIGIGQVSYVDFVIPGYVVSSVLFAGAGAAAGMAEDIDQGFSDRLRSLPVTNTALLTGRSVADTALLTWGLISATTVAFLIGYRFHGGVLSALAAFGLCIVYGFAFTWLFIYIGSIADSARVAQSTSMLVFTLAGVSSAWVPVETMPGWMQPIADNQPVTIMTNAVRSLVLDDPSLAGLDRNIGYWIPASLLWCIGIIAVFAPLAVARYRHS